MIARSARGMLPGRWLVLVRGIVRDHLSHGDATARLTVRDWAFAALAMAASVVQVSFGPAAEPPVAIVNVASGLAILGGVALAWRRRRPVVAVAVSVIAVSLHAILVGPAIPVVGWLAVLAVARHVPDLSSALRSAAVAALTLAAAQTAASLIYGQTGGLAVVLALTLVVLLAAAVVRLQVARVRSQQRERDAARERAVTAERLRIARDLHDLVGHGLSTVAIQSGAARLALDAGDPVAARRAVASVEQASRAALAEMRQLLGVLRTGADSAAPAPGLNGIDALADRAREAGHGVTVDRSGPLDVLPAAAALCGYRVVQEAVTNAIRYAPGAAIHVRLAVDGDRLIVEVSDEGAAPAGVDAAERPRYGLVGLRERVAAAGGTVEAGPREGRSGWRVTARVPLSEETPT